ncbi:MAG TPA: flagellar basal body rod C-terminal domain-containing protein [Dyella sp.]|uniref:flagellar basal body rod protein FlgC n=1 Tax=Dyella sp. TaxID=1869338 RepID=UPI002F93F0DD
MSVDAIFAATRYGLEFERLRLEAASHNIAVANTPAEPGHPARLMHVAAGFGANFDGSLGAPHGAASAPVMLGTDAPLREVRDPSDPSADAKGMVSYPKVDMVTEMGALIEANRAYEANVRAFNTLRSMALRALDLGGES